MTFQNPHHPPIDDGSILCFFPSLSDVIHPPAVKLGNTHVFNSSSACHIILMAFIFNKIDRLGYTDVGKKIVKIH